MTDNRDIGIDVQIEKIASSEAAMKHVPTEDDYSEARRLLNDFDIDKEIPKCKSINELQRFTRTAIRERLGDD